MLLHSYANMAIHRVKVHFLRTFATISQKPSASAVLNVTRTVLVMDIIWPLSDVSQPFTRTDPFSGREIHFRPDRALYADAHASALFDSWDSRGFSYDECPFCGPSFSSAPEIVEYSELFCVLHNRFPYLVSPSDSKLVTYPSTFHAQSFTSAVFEPFVAATDWILGDFRQNNINNTFHSYGPNSRASVAHLHWQGNRFEVTPPVLARETFLHVTGNNVLARVLYFELTQNVRIVANTPNVCMFVPWWDASEIIVTPPQGVARFESTALGSAIFALVSALGSDPAVSVGWWLHANPNSPGFIEHAHVRLDPTDSSILTDSSGIVASSKLPRDTASFLREALIL